MIKRFGDMGILNAKLLSHCVTEIHIRGNAIRLAIMINAKNCFPSNVVMSITVAPKTFLMHISFNCRVMANEEEPASPTRDSQAKSELNLNMFEDNLPWWTKFEPAENSGLLIKNKNRIYISFTFFYKRFTKLCTKEL